jgi:methionine-rich copper-binding protein CopC
MSYRSARIAALAAVLSLPVIGTAFSHESAAASSAPRFHLFLDRAEPKINDTISASPKAIKLWFSESVSPKAIAIRVTGPNNHPVKTGEPTVDAAEHSPAVFSVPETLAAGVYTVSWRAMGDDGHATSGKYSFTLR